MLVLLTSNVVVVILGDMTTATKPRMKPEVKEAWVAALLSGEFPQAKGTLYTPGPSADEELDENDNATEGYCCLGVLCHVATKATKRHIPNSAWVGESMPPKEVLVWAGLVTKEEAAHPEFYAEDRDDLWRTNARRRGFKADLPSLNDGYVHGHDFKPATFAEIAKIIERDF